MSSTIKTYQVGAVAVTTPEQLGKLEHQIRLALGELRIYRESDPDSWQLEEIERGIVAALRVVDEQFRPQLDAAHGYMLIGPGLDPLFQWEIDAAQADAEQMRAELAAAERAA